MGREQGHARTCAAYILMGLGETFSAWVEKRVRPGDKGHLSAVAPVLSNMQFDALV